MDEPLRILIVDDDPFNLDLLQQELEDLGCELETARDGREGLRKLAHGFPGILVTDLKMPHIDGLELMRRARALDAELPVILLTAHGDIATAVQAIQDGAYDFLERPYDADRLREKVARALGNRSLVLENRALRAQLVMASGIDARILGESASVQELRKTIANLADTGANILIRGETGTGKELVARCLHELSSRAENKFVAVNCGAMPEGLFESELFGFEAGAFSDAKKRRIGRIEYAHEGTLFLDEVESTPPSQQAKLLRVLQERQVERLGSNEPIAVDFRVVAATQVDLMEAVQVGDFRQDLYYRLNVAEIHIPPLRERREDILLLFNAFAQELAAKHEREVPNLSSEEARALMAYTWPGNVRELRNIAERRVFGLPIPGGISVAHTESGGRTQTLSEQLDTFERSIIEQELARNKGGIQATAKALGLPVRTLNDRMRKHGLNRKAHL